MKNYLSNLDLAIWLVLIAGKLFLCLCIWRKQLFLRTPWFSAYVFVYTVKSVLLFITALKASYVVYYYAFYLSGYAETTLAFLTLVECGRRVLPGLNLPQREKALAYLFAALMAVAIFVSIWPIRTIGKRVELGGYLGVAIAFIFIAAYSRYLGLYWSRLLAGISFNLGLLYLIDSAAKAMINHYPSAMVLQVRQISQIANVLAVIAWIVVVLSPWGESVMTEEDLQVLESAFAKIEDSLGSERIKAL